MHGFEQITEYAAFHHEQLNGNGYPFCRNEHNIGTGARIIAVADIFTALYEDRPYRARMEHAEVISTLKEFVNRKHLDAKIVGLLTNNIDVVQQKMQEQQAKTLDYYNTQFKMLD